MGLLDSDLGVYVASGVFAVLVFIIAMWVLIARTPVEPTAGTIGTFTVGFLLFVGVYFAAMAVYRGIESREDVK